MAGVENANILEFFRERCVQIAEENISLKQAQNRIGNHLRQIGYETTAEQRGTIKDISTPQRQNITLKPHVALALGWEHRQKSLSAATSKAWQLHRAGESHTPRDRDTRWREAAETINGEGIISEKQITSPIWQTLSIFGHPYPPFDFNSNMRARLVPFPQTSTICPFHPLRNGPLWSR